MPLPDSPTHPATPAADAWLAAADAVDGDTTWRTAAPEFQQAITVQQWSAQLAAAHTSAGAFAGRRLAVAQESDTLPGAPPGPYVVLQYHAIYGGQAAVERLTLQRQGDGTWRVAGYFIT